MTPRLVLVGGGHAHLFVLESLAMRRIPTDQAVLVAPSPGQTYSGMVPGLIEGRYTVPDLRFDLPAIAAAARAEFVEGRVVRIDSAAQEVELEGGRRLPYDVLSVAVGSEPVGSELPGVDRHALTLKPIERVLAIVPALERAARQAGPEAVRAVIVGAGAAGVEVALAVRRRLDRLGAIRAVILLVEAAHEIMGDRAPGTIREARVALRRAEITLRLSSTAAEVGPDYLRLSNGAVLPADALLWATGPRGPALFKDSGLEVDLRGYLLVDDTLRALSHPQIFGAGDAVTMRSYPRVPKAGVYAVRAGSILAENLAAACRSAPPVRRYRPQPRFLALLNTSDGRAILSYGRVATTARWAMSLKDRIDRSFMRRFQRIGQQSQG